MSLAQSNENHEGHFSDFRWPAVASVNTMATVLKRVTPEPNLTRRATMWTKPEFTEMRFGFEVTMYIANR
jgi:coenzyme PQQ precursor peptide PqqA